MNKKLLETFSFRNTVTLHSCEGLAVISLGEILKKFCFQLILDYVVFVHIFCIYKLYHIKREISLEKFMLNSNVSLPVFTLSCNQGWDL